MDFNGDRLMHALSIRPVVPWDAFKQIYNRIVLETNATHESDDVSLSARRHDDLRVLDMLGFVEVNFSYGREPLRVAPSVVYTPLIPGPPTAVITGARLLGFHDQLTDCLQGSGITLKVPGISRFNVPAELHMEADDDAVFPRVAEELGLQFRRMPAATLGANLGTIKRYASQLEWDFSAPPSQCQLFCTQDLVFKMSTRIGKPGLGFGLLRHSDRVTKIPRYIWWAENAGAFVEAEWGRWLALAKARRNVISYDEESGALEIPRTCPLPLFHAKAAALASGRTPRYAVRPGCDMISIPGVPESLARRLAETLGQVI